MRRHYSDVSVTVNHLTQEASDERAIMVNTNSVRAQVERRQRGILGTPGLRLLHEDAEHLDLAADVLVIGGGPAATWAAISAAEHGAAVVLVDKGYCGASGAAATSGVGHLLAPPNTEKRERVIRQKEQIGGRLSDHDWFEDVLDTAWERIQLLPQWGWERRKGLPAAQQPSLRLSETDGAEDHYRRAPAPYFTGPAPDYLRFLRSRVLKAGALILDHSPAVELLLDESSGELTGARGYQRQQDREWAVRAPSVILATGGTTWKNKCLGADVNTGDGQLMAVEAGAHLSGMEFSNYPGIVAAGTSLNKNRYFSGASYWDAQGNPIPYENLGASRLPLLEKSLEGSVTAQFTQFSTREDQQRERETMPNFFMVTDKMGYDPFREPFPIGWVNEGTVRGTGGVRLDDRSCSTGVPGLYAAGDTAARDRLVGGHTGGGGPNLSWAVASGSWSGRDAAEHAAARPLSPHARTVGAGGYGLRRQMSGRRVPDWRQAATEVLAETAPIEKSFFRSEESLRIILERLGDTWGQLIDGAPDSAYEEFRTREAVAMTAMARWANTAARERRESRGMHRRVDHPTTDQAHDARLLIGGLDEIWTLPDPERPRSLPLPAQAAA